MQSTWGLPSIMASVAKCVELYRAQCNAEQMLKDEANDEPVKTVSDGENNCAVEVDVAEAFDQFVQDAVEAKCHERIHELENKNEELEEQKKKLEEQKKQLEEGAKAAAIIANEKLRNRKQGEPNKVKSETLRKKTLRRAWLEMVLYIILCTLFLSPEPTIVVRQPVCYYHPTHSVCTTVWSTSNVMPTHWLKCRPLVEEKRLATYLGDQLMSTGEHVLSVMNAVGTQTTKLIASNQKVVPPKTTTAPIELPYVMPKRTSFFNPFY